MFNIQVRKRFALLIGLKKVPHKVFPPLAGGIEGGGCDVLSLERRN